jgi:hypothetical protein
MHFDEVFRQPVTRRGALKLGAAAAVASQAAMLDQLVVAPWRPALAASGFSDIQFDIGKFVAPAKVFNDGGGDVLAGFGVVFALFVPARLTRNPTLKDQAMLANALNTIEGSFPTSPAGLFVHVHYGLPYFNRLPQSLVRSRIPRLLSDPNRLALEEAVPSPTDVVGGLVGGPNAPIPGVTKDRFNINVRIETNDVLFHFKSDSVGNLAQVMAWLEGSSFLNGRSVRSPDWDGLFAFQTPRLQFVQPGLPRKVANAAGFEFASRVNPNSSMAFGAVDQAVNAAGPPQIVTFVGNSSAKLTNAQPGDYFDNGSIAHFSHDIDDAYQFYATPNQDARHPDGEPYTERIMYLFRVNQLGTAHGLPSEGRADQYANGGGPAFLNNEFQGTDAAMRGARGSAGKFTPANASLDATFTGLGRIGHESGLQRVSRAADGTPLHIRNDGPGFDGMDVPAFRTFPGANGQDMPAGTNQFKLQFLIFMPTADLFTRMRAAVAAQDLQKQFNVDPGDNGLERFITATRRQNFLVPPRRHRSFPLLELAGGDQGGGGDGGGGGRRPPGR